MSHRIWLDRDTCKRAFSMVEVALALGIVAFALLTLLALLPLGVKSNQISTEETRASGILTALEADLRNTHPLLASGKSLQYGLVLPYTYTSNQVRFNTSLAKNSVTSDYSVELADSESPVSGSEPARFQATVAYTRIASDLPANSLAPLEARLIVSWPPLPNPSSVADFTDTSKVSGFVEAYVTFPSP